jgi:hypothetical protein
VPHIIVVADGQTARADGAVTLRERISASDLASGHFAGHLLERLNWAVEDAHEAESADPEPLDPMTPNGPKGRTRQPPASVATTAS